MASHTLIFGGFTLSVTGSPPPTAAAAGTSGTARAPSPRSPARHPPPVHPGRVRDRLQPPPLGQPGCCGPRRPAGPGTRLPRSRWRAAFSASHCSACGCPAPKTSRPPGPGRRRRPVTWPAPGTAGRSRSSGRTALPRTRTPPGPWTGPAAAQTQTSGSGGRLNRRLLSRRHFRRRRLEAARDQGQDHHAQYQPRHSQRNRVAVQL